jgi:excisionase family DNA binding protein
MSDLEILRNEIRELRTISLLTQKDTLDIDEAALFTGLSKQTLYTMCRTRTIPHYKSQGGKKTYFKKSELNDWMLHTQVKVSSELESESARKVFLRN